MKKDATSAPEIPQKAFPFLLSSPSSSSYHEHGNDEASGTAPRTSIGVTSSTFISSQTTQEKQQQQQEKYNKNCNDYVRTGLSRNVTVQFLMKRLMELGCDPPKGFIKCIDCGDKQAGGGFGVVEEMILPPPTSPTSVLGISSNRKGGDDNGKEDSLRNIEEFQFREHVKERKMRQCQGTSTMEDLKRQILAQKEGKVKLRLLPEIFLCQQHLVNEQHAHESMVHELIHAIDLCRTKMDPIHNCIHMACTEIRAENLSGECGAVRELVNQRTTLGKFRGHGAECVKRRAILSVKANPNCSAKAADYVDAAFERCFRDTFPFDRHPNLR